MAKHLPAETGLIRTRTRADGSTAYRAVWDAKVDGVWRQVSRTFDTLEAAQTHLRGIAQAKREGRYRGPSQVTVLELVTDYIERAGDSGRISERTVLTYRARAASMIAPTIGKRKLDTIAPLDVQRWIDGLVKQKFSASTIHAAIAVLMGALREAALLGVTDRHLGQGVRRPTIGRQTSDTWDEHEVRRVLKAVRDDITYGAFYVVAIATGMRPGELRAVKWADVDLDAGLILVRRTLTKDLDGREIIADRTKSKTSRGIAVAPAVVERLRWHRARQHERRLACASWQSLDLVFDRGNGGILPLTSWQKFHRALCQRVDVRPIRLHDLRHTAATLMVLGNVHPKIISNILGHHSIDITMDRYSHPTVEDQRGATAKLSNILFDDVAGNRA